MIPKDCKRLAEVDFPIAEVSRHAAREKSIRHGYPSTLHLWWARRHALPARPAQPAIPPGTTGLGDRAWRMERDGRGWIMNLKGLSWEEPQGLCLKDCEARTFKQSAGGAFFPKTTTTHADRRFESKLKDTSPP